MRTRLRSKMMLLFMTCALLLAVPAMALADDISNNLDGSIDATVEATSVDTGSTKSVGYLVQPRNNPDPENGCNLQGSETLKVDVTSSNTAVATVSPSQLTFGSCGDTPSVTVTGVNLGTASITLKEVSNNTGGTFNLNTATFSVTVSNPTPPADSTAPTIDYALSPGSPDGNNGWYKSDVSLVWNVTDPESSVTKTGCVNQNITADQAATTYSCSASSAGGSAGPVNVTIKRDGSAPKAPNATTDPLNPVANSGGFFKDSVKVTYGGSTDVGPSGIADYTTDQTFSTTGTHPYSGTATDNAGNVSAPTNGEVKVDATDPTVAITGCPGSVLLNSTQKIIVTASDEANGSGLVSDPSGEVALDTSSVGSKTKTITVKDKVGHTKSDSCEYSVNYNFGGFLQPINDTAHDLNGNPNVSTFKLGSTVPVKFKLTDANGNAVQPATAPQWTVQQGKATSQAVDETVYTEAATAGNLYKYDTTAQQYIYNWSTKGMSSGFYYKIGVKLDDGQTYYTYISLR